MAAAADSPASVATDLAEMLVANGIPFRQAHAIVGEMVRTSLIGALTLVELAVAHPNLGPDAEALFEPGAAARRRTSPGGAGPAPVQVQLDQLNTYIKTLQSRI